MDEHLVSYWHHIEVENYKDTVSELEAAEGVLLFVQEGRPSFEIPKVILSRKIRQTG
jgi:hypothetical protein